MIENFQAVVQAVLNFIRIDLKARIGLFFERALETLRERVYTSFSARQQSRVAERWLSDGQRTLETALHQRMVEAFLGQDAKKDVTADELRLLDDESLNVVMLRARLVNSVMEKARDSVVAVEVRLEALKQSGAKINARAFTPGAIADGFIGTLDKLSVPTEVQIVLMEAYTDGGAEMLTEFYQKLNELLISKGVMPGFTYSLVKAPPSKGKRAAPVAWPWSPYPGAGGAPGVAVPPGGAMPPGGGAMPSGGAAPGGKPGEAKTGMEWVPPWPSISAGAAIPAHFAQLVDMKLNSMQQALDHLTAETWNPGTLRETFALPPPISLSPEQEESIDHIEAVFLDLIRDTRISERFRSELNRLILPLMSLRLTDAELFRNPENPVRRFIRQLALLGFRDLELPIKEFEHISLVVGRIVSERGREVASFSSGADALYTIARNEVKLQLEARLPRGRLPAAEETAEITEETVTESHRFVRDALRSMSAGFHLPSVVQHFVLRLLAPWMMVRYQRYGEDSDEMRDSILFASSFFSLLEPAVDEEDHQIKIQERQRAVEQMAFKALRARMKEDEMRILLEGLAEYFEGLNADSVAGLVRSKGSEDSSFVSYLDDMPVARSR